MEKALRGITESLAHRPKVLPKLGVSKLGRRRGGPEEAKAVFGTGFQLPRLKVSLRSVAGRRMTLTAMLLACWVILSYLILSYLIYLG